MTRIVSPQKNTHDLAEYAARAAETDRLANSDLAPILLGLYGEVGSIMAAAKKLHREKAAFAGYQLAVEEEFGDALWYLAALCRRLSRPLEQVMSQAADGDGFSASVAAGGSAPGAIARVIRPVASPDLDKALLRLGAATANLLDLTTSSPEIDDKLVAFAREYLHALGAASVTFSAALETNLRKARGRFIRPNLSDLPNFDSSFPADERLPDHFEITIRQRSSGKTCLEWNGVFIGDPLTDNIRDQDGYRYHDVFHFTNAAVLHWSPTFRALIKRKRKSQPKVDEAQDSGRAIVVEEGLSAWIFSCAKELDFFNGQTGVSFDLLKTISQFVRGYEVETCPLKLWEDCILQGYEVFREIRRNQGGIVVGNRIDRRVSYKPLSTGGSH